MQLSDAEWIVMNLIWDSQPTEASDVIEALGSDNGWSDATVKTMLHRLVKKGALATDKIGKEVSLHHGGPGGVHAFEKQVDRSWMLCLAEMQHRLSCTW